MQDLLGILERYYDAVPRVAASAAKLGPFTLFVNPGPGWSYYARPALGSQAFIPDDVRRVLERQRFLGVPEALEWVAETTPALRYAAEAADLAVHDHPLLVLDGALQGADVQPAGVTLRIVTPDDDLGQVSAVAVVAFGAPGTAVGNQGPAELAEAAAARTPDQVTFERERVRAGLTVMAAAYVDGAPVAVGSHQPVGTVSEIVGVGTLPAFRRRGIASAVTKALVENARNGGVETIFLSADDDAVARIYERLGFRRTATACVAEPPD